MSDTNSIVSLGLLKTPHYQKQTKQNGVDEDREREGVMSGNKSRRQKPDLLTTRQLNA